MIKEGSSPLGAIDDLKSRVLTELVSLRDKDGTWMGALSSSALSTATALVVLFLYDHRKYASQVDEALEWLVKYQNADGGWGDTVRSKSNVSTTLLVWAAYHLADSDISKESYKSASHWLERDMILLEPEHIVKHIEKRYGKDRTFSIPILTLCAICRCLGDEQQAWKNVRSLPFELALLPHRWFERIHLPVVSYALPALIAIGVVRYVKKPPLNPLIAKLREWALPRALQKLMSIQPIRGGFLEATPLTSFVSMSLIQAGLKDTPIVERGLSFILRSQREDGSWPIDTNLNTWVTTLAVNGSGAGACLEMLLDHQGQKQVSDWLLTQQFTQVHPYTKALPGGWAWTPLSGGVPDADDTSGAILALKYLSGNQESAEKGIQWLLDLQNKDGGVPTFCRGWGALPFDRSSPDITAHALRALMAWRSQVGSDLRMRMDRFSRKAMKYLSKEIEQGGSWCPLWFGCQETREEVNRTYGTSRVVLALAETGLSEKLARKGVVWLLRAQNKDGSWGGDQDVVGSIEETALAVEALAAWTQVHFSESAAEACGSAVKWLEKAWTQERVDAYPMGFYFARLWYYEKLYPYVYSIAALGRLQLALSD
ncbi:MAG: prenyltransferase/squalene oxidase repeat-containing protein [Verrucomicrobiota bacterium]